MSRRTLRMCYIVLFLHNNYTLLSLVIDDLSACSCISSTIVPYLQSINYTLNFLPVDNNNQDYVD